MLLTVKNLTKQYSGGTVALSKVSFTVCEGEFVSIIGPSGADNRRFFAASTG